MNGSENTGHSLDWSICDDEFFAQVYEMYMPRVYFFFYMRIGNHSEAEDLTSGVFIKVFEKRASFDPNRSAFATWLFNIARNMLTDFYRTRKVNYPLTPEYADDRPDPAPTPEMSALNAEQQHELDGLLAHLSAKEAIVLHYRYYHNLSNREIARRTGLNENTVSTLNRRALEKLRVMVKNSQFPSDFEYR